MVDGKKCVVELPLTVVMEVTGTYHEELAYFLHQQQRRVAIVLPNKVKAFARSHNQHSKTDVIDALVIACMGLERQLRAWVTGQPIDAPASLLKP